MPEQQDQPERDVWVVVDYSDPEAQAAAKDAQAEWQRKHRDAMYALELKRRSERLWY
jgi:hypothetical protein